MQSKPSALRAAIRPVTALVILVLSMLISLVPPPTKASAANPVSGSGSGGAPSLNYIDAGHIAVDTSSASYHDNAGDPINLSQFSGVYFDPNVVDDNSGNSPDWTPLQALKQGHSLEYRFNGSSSPTCSGTKSDGSTPGPTEVTLSLDSQGNIQGSLSMWANDPNSNTPNICVDAVFNNVLVLNVLNGNTSGLPSSIDTFSVAYPTPPPHSRSTSKVFTTFSAAVLPSNVLFYEHDNKSIWEVGNDDTWGNGAGRGRFIYNAHHITQAGKSITDYLQFAGPRNNITKDVNYACPDFIEIPPNAGGGPVVVAQYYSASFAIPGSGVTKQYCQVKQPKDILLLTETPEEFAAQQLNIGGSTGSGSTTTATQSLSCSAGFNPLNWLICGVVDGLVVIVRQLDNFINQWLSIGTQGSNSNGNPTTIFGSGSTAQDYKSAWASLRDIALAVLLIAALIVIGAETLGFEALDAYTIRKVMPRLIAMAIIITLSWSLMQFFVQLTNDLGYGVRYLIFAPFKNLPDHVNLGGAGDVAVDLLGFGAITAMGIFGLLSFALTAALAVFVAFLVLIIRQILIIGLIIFAPVALAMYILPNTQRVFHLWWESFSKALLMFPLIAGIIAIGRVFSAIAVQNTSAFAQLVGFAAYFAPYLLIPSTFKFAGGALRQLGGFVNDRHRGAFDRLRNYRGHKTKENMENIRAGKRWQGNRIGERASRSLQTASLLGEAGLNPLRARGRIRSARSARTSALSAEGEKSEAVRAVAGNDALLTAALAGNGTEADARHYLYREAGLRGRELEQGVGSIRQAKRAMGPAAFEDWAAAAIAGTGTGYGKGPSEMLRTISRVSRGDTARQNRILNSARGQAEKARRLDLYGSSFGRTSDVMGQLAAGAITDAQANKELTDAALAGKSAAEVGSQRTGGLTNMRPALDRRIATSQTALAIARTGGAAADIAVAEHEYKRTMAFTANVLDAASGFSPDNATITGAIMGQNMGGTTVGGEIEALRNDPEFQQYRREYRNIPPTGLG